MDTPILIYFSLHLETICLVSVAFSQDFIFLSRCSFPLSLILHIFWWDRGYMAPEYLVRGQLTEKADVFSFGVLVLEIVCGRRNNAFIDDCGSLLQTVRPASYKRFLAFKLFGYVGIISFSPQVWQLYRTSRLAEAADPCLRAKFPEKEVSDVLQIGLLCTQASVALRPSMDEIIQLLTDKDCEIPIPKQPPFLSANVLEPSSSIKSYSMNSLGSNAARKTEASYTSTESSSMDSSDVLSRS